MIHAPVVHSSGDRRIFVGRSQLCDHSDASAIKKDSNYGLLMCDITVGAAEYFLTTPCHSDSSYSGLVQWGNEKILMAYYSQHESKKRYRQVSF